MDPVEPAPADPVEPTAPVEPETPVTPPEGEPEPTGEDERLKKARSEAKNLRDRLKAAEALIKERDDADKTESQKLAERAEAAEQATVGLLKRAVLAESGLGPEADEFLNGGDEESLLASAERLKALIGAKAPEGDPPADPPKGWPNAPQGPRGNPKPAGLAEQIAQLEAAGKYAEAAPLKGQLAAQHIAGS